METRSRLVQPACPMVSETLAIHGVKYSDTLTVRIVCNLCPSLRAVERCSLFTRYATCIVVCDPRVAPTHRCLVYSKVGRGFGRSDHVEFICDRCPR